jgi:hypothetical protein
MIQFKSPIISNVDFELVDKDVESNVESALVDPRPQV